MNYARRGQLIAQNSYHETDLVARIEGASPHALVTLLYEQLLEALDVMAAMLAQGKSLGQSRHSARAQSIVVALQVSLDFARGGAVAESLGRVYRGMATELSKVIVNGDPDRLSQLRHGILSIANAWQKVGTPTHEEA
jgi:flagellar secretion chaperone FliS